MNAIKTVLLLGLMSGLLLVGGEMIGGRQGLLIGLAMAIIFNFASYFFSDKIVLATYSAQPVTPEQNGFVYSRIAPMVERLVQRMSIPMPKLWLLPDSSPNAFATGRDPNHASVAVTTGILELMNDDEVEAVIAHELGHVKNRDILISSIAATLAAAITFLARMAFFVGPRNRDDEEGGGGGGIFMLFLAPIAAMMIQMAISRTREYSADAAAARYTGDANKMIGALRKLEAYSKRIPMDASPSTAHMFIIQPFSGGGIMKLFSTHPSTEQRIARLEAGPANA